MFIFEPIRLDCSIKGEKSMGFDDLENNGGRGYIIRGVLTVASIMIYGWINYLLNSMALLGAGKMAAKQFENSDMAYVTSQFGMDFFKHLGVPALVLLAIIALIWWKPLRSFIKSGLVPLVLLTVLTASTSCYAYYNQSDYAEPFFILPNESAFFIPDVGNNKNGQASFQSEEYLREHKIAAKRFVIPHVKLENSAFWKDYYVPGGRLIIVDRTPYNREWVTESNRGTSSRNEGFPVQSKEGLNITVGVSIAASVSEDNAPKFLYRFGIKPPVGNRTRPEVIFTSVYYGHSLTEVMDGVVRDKVQALLGEEFTSRTFDQDNGAAGQIMADVQKKLTAYLDSVGVTLDYIGWADTFQFDPEVQSAINRRYIASQDQAIAQSLSPYTGTIQALAAADALRNFGQKTDGKLPSTLSLWWLPSSLNDFVSEWLKGSSPASGAPVKRK